MSCHIEMFEGCGATYRVIPWGNRSSGAAPPTALGGATLRTMRPVRWTSSPSRFPEQRRRRWAANPSAASSVRPATPTASRRRPPAGGGDVAKALPPLPLASWKRLASPEDASEGEVGVLQPTEAALPDDVTMKHTLRPTQTPAATAEARITTARDRTGREDRFPEPFEGGHLSAEAPTSATSTRASRGAALVLMAPVIIIWIKKIRG
mmetsp:Transcript_111248/g.321662  ORF Transcript_111248/g.321662 Transcript_111248/m.321662 type:complete len:208 (-) Transcript_111248:167-790(-)